MRGGCRSCGLFDKGRLSGSSGWLARGLGRFDGWDRGQVCGSGEAVRASGQGLRQQPPRVLGYFRVLMGRLGFGARV